MRNHLICVFLATFLALSANAAPLDDAREAGHVVETPDGFIKARPGAPAYIDALVKEINQRRYEAYKRIAEEHGISVEQVGAESYRKRMSSGDGRN